MGTTEFRFTSEDITTVFDALHGFDPEEIACALLESGASCQSQGKHEPPKIVGMAERRIASLLRVLFRLGPNCEASSKIVLPWRASHLAQLSCMSWPDALGMRIAMPSDISRSAKSRLLANVLMSMSYV